LHAIDYTDNSFAHHQLKQSPTSKVVDENAREPQCCGCEAREVFEREYLVAQISRFGGNISRTAEFIGMERSALHRKLKSLGID
jgi:DNA-binding NtrC family response regulator